MKPFAQLVTAALIAIPAAPAYALILNPNFGATNSALNFTVDGNEFSSSDGDSTTSFVNSTISRPYIFNPTPFVQSVSGTDYTMNASAVLNLSATWIEPIRGTIDYSVDIDVVGNGFPAPTSLAANLSWGYVFVTGALPVLFSSRLQPASNNPNTAWMGSVTVRTVGNDITGYCGTFTCNQMLDANTFYFVTLDFDANISSTTGFDYSLYAAPQVNWSISAVPEPASWAMLIAGFGLTGASLRRRRKGSVGNGAARGDRRSEHRLTGL